MKTRKEMKHQAKKSLKRHYWLLVALCLAATVIGAEFVTSMEGFRLQDTSAGKGRTAAVQQNDTISGSGSISAKLGELLIEDDSSWAEQAEERKDGYVEESKEQQEQRQNMILGRTRGVLSGVVNNVASGSYLAALAVSIKSITGSKNATMVILIIAAVLIYYFVQTFVVAVYRVIMRRMFLEARVYEKVPFQRLWFLLKVKKWLKTGVTILLAEVLEFLWSLTIVGAAVKRYSYYLVPFIAAENPAVGSRQAITLSRKMMNGHKWECFVMELSFLGWMILGAVTLGLVDLFFTNPYKTAAMSEFYTKIRSEAKEKEIEGAELLNDRYLFEKPDDAVLQEVYAEVEAEMKKPKTKLAGVHGIQLFMAEVFGLALRRQKNLEQYEEEQATDFRMAYDIEVCRGNVYPTRLSRIKETQKRRWVESLNYIRYYSVWSVIMMFFIMSFVGWLWEVGLHLVTDGIFVNRGSMHGPWLPIYGAGSVMILLLLNKFRRRPAAEFAAAVVLCGFVEYFTSYFMEIMHDGMKWWDYSGYFLNLNGRICAEGLLTFGIGGMAVVYVLAPFMDNLIRRIPVKPLVITCLLLLGIFAADNVYSSSHPNMGKGITDYKNAGNTTVAAVHHPVPVHPAAGTGLDESVSSRI